MRTYDATGIEPCVQIELTKDQWTYVDVQDLPIINRYTWCASRCGNQKYKRKWYAMTSINNRLTGMHRVLMSPPNGFVVDHRNGDGLDNVRANLRVVTQRQNIIMKSKNPNTRSHFRGITFDKKKNLWMAQLCSFRKRYFLGYARTEEDAARLYDMGARKHFGEFAITNFPKEN